MMRNFGKSMSDPFDLNGIVDENLSGVPAHYLSSFKWVSDHVVSCLLLLGPVCSNRLS